MIKLLRVGTFLLPFFREYKQILVSYKKEQRNSLLPFLPNILKLIALQ